MSGVQDGFMLLLSVMWVVPLGLLVGMFVGALPGLNSSGMLAVMLPLLILMPPEIGLIFTVSLYAGGEVGNSFPAVMLNIPGNASSAVTAIEGYPMTLRGEGAKALGICIMASTLGAVIGGLAAITAAPVLANFALRFSSVEIAIVIVFGLVAIAQVATGSLLKGIMAGALGLLVAAIGTDPIWGQFRGTFDSVYLYDGMPVIPVLIGLLGFSELLKIIENGAEKPKAQTLTSIGLQGIVSGFKSVLRKPLDWIPASATGLIVGIIPGAGSSVASFIAYQQSMAMAGEDDRKAFGNGSEKGLIAADTANNSMVGGSLVPLLTLGIPGSSSMAVMLVVMGYHNLQIGPLLFQNHPELAYAVLLSQFVASIFMLVIGTCLAWFAYRLASVPVNTFLPVVAVFCLIGGFAQNQYVFDMGIMLIFGVIGFVMKKNGYSVIALLLGVILGSLFEGHVNRAIMMGQGSFEIFFTRPLALLLWGLLFITLLGPYLVRWLRRSKQFQRSSVQGL